MALDLEWLSEIYQAVGYNSQICADRNGVLTEHRIGDSVAKIKTVLWGTFPKDHPKYFLIAANTYEQLAHVTILKGGDGLICIGRQDQFHLNYDEPDAVAVDGLKKAVAILDKAFSDPDWNLSELIREFSDHWAFLAADRERVILMAEPSETPVLLTSLQAVEKSDQYLRGSRLLIEKDAPVNDFHVIRDEIKDRRVQGKGLLITLEKVIPAPLPGSDISDWWSRLLECQSEELLAVFSEAARHHKAKVFYLVCHAVHQDYQVWFVLVARSADKQYAPLGQERLRGWDFTAAIMNSPISTRSLLPRGGASPALQSCKVCVIGCGSVGGYIVDQLASSGVGSITIVDNDTFKLENLHRHYLNAYFLGQKKSTAMAIAIMTKYPFVNVVGESGTLEKFIEDGRLGEFNLIVLATGNVTLERFANEQLFRTVDPATLISTWVEAYGVGGHAIVAIPEAEGCLSCIYTGDEIDNLDLYPCLSFIKRNQSVRANHAGCGTDYIAYSNADAIQTATIASRLALRALAGVLTQGVSVSWKGAADLAIEHGIMLSERYNSENRIMQEIPLYVRGCNVCS